MKRKDCFIGSQAGWCRLSRCHGKSRASVISATLSVKTRRHARSSPPQHLGGRKEGSPLLAGDDCRILTGSVAAVVLCVSSVWSRQATGTVWPKSQMAFGATGALQSQRFKKLSRLTPSLLWLTVDADSSSLTQTMFSQVLQSSCVAFCATFYAAVLPRSLWQDVSKLVYITGTRNDRSSKNSVLRNFFSCVSKYSSSTRGTLSGDWFRRECTSSWLIGHISQCSTGNRHFKKLLAL